MANLQEVPTDELLSFQDYPVVHNPNSNPGINSQHAQISININDDAFNDFDKNNVTADDPLEREVTGTQNKESSIWSLNYYQKFFDVDTKDVTDRIIASMVPKFNNSLQEHIRRKPDLYGPFWISTTLVFAIAVTGNIANYLHHADNDYEWRYDFKLVSYAATAIWMYVILVPILLWSVLIWTLETATFNEEERPKSAGLLELICIYGYSLFIYIPVSILWSIQISSLQWTLAIFSALLSGSVLLITLMPSIRGSKHKAFLSIAIIACHLFLAAGFMLYFFHTPDHGSIQIQDTVSSNTTLKPVINITKATLTNITKVILVNNTKGTHV